MKYDFAFWNLLKNPSNRKLEDLENYAKLRQIPVLNYNQANDPDFSKTVFRTAKEYVIIGDNYNEVKKTVQTITKNRAAHVITDTLENISQKELEELKELGAKLVTTSEVLNRKIV